MACTDRMITAHVTCKKEEIQKQINKQVTSK